MSKNRFLLHLVPFVLLVCLMAPTFAAAASPDPSFCYLGTLVKGYPEKLAIQLLKGSGVEVAMVQDGMILFRLTGNSKLTRVMKNLPFLKNVYLDKSAAFENPKLKDLAIVERFARMSCPGGASAKAGEKVLEPSGNTAILLGQPGVSTTMLALDALLRRHAAASPRRGMFLAADDLYEPNDTFETAVEVAPGTFSGLQCLNDDWYKVNVAAGKDFVVTIDFLFEDGDLDLYILDSSGDYIRQSAYRPRDWEKVVLGDLEAGTYYIYVCGWSGATNAYSMTVESGDILGAISGTVTSESTFAGIENVEVGAYDWDYYYVDSAYSGPSGNYSFAVPAGDYIVYFDGYDVNYLSEFYNNKTEPEYSNDVIVEGTSVTFGINAALTPGGKISGRVTSEASGLGLADGWVAVYDDYDYIGYESTDDDGYYEVRALPAGTFVAEAGSGGYYIPEWYDPIVVTAGATTPNIDFALALGGAISGRVTDISSGAGIPDVVIMVFDVKGNAITNDWTDPEGYYSVGQIPVGTIKARFSPDAGNYLTEWYNNQAAFEPAIPIPVTANQTTTGIDVQLEKGGIISGFVTDGLTNSLGNVIVRAFDLSQNEVARGWTDGEMTSGKNFSLVLRAGTYRIMFDTTYQNSYGTEWYSNKVAFNGADIVIVAADQETPGIDAALDEAGFLEMNVENPQGLSLQGVIAAVFDLNQNYLFSSRTSISGYAGIQLKPGAYKLYFDPNYIQGKYVAEWYNDKTSFTDANPVTIAAGLGTAVKAALASPTSITITSPMTGNTWFTGAKGTISWFKNGSQNANVKIQLYNKTKLAKTIALKTANDGSYDWTIPGATAAGSEYRIKITTSDNKLSSTSGYFSIAKPLIAVTAPTTGSVWSRGATYDIAWTKTGPMAATVKIMLYKGATLVKTLATSTENDGIFSWLIPSTGLAAASTYKLKVQTTVNAVSGTSKTFSIN